MSKFMAYLRHVRFSEPQALIEQKLEVIRQLELHNAPHIGSRFLDLARRKKNGVPIMLYMYHGTRMVGWVYLAKKQDGRDNTYEAGAFVAEDFRGRGLSKSAYRKLISKLPKGLLITAYGDSWSILSNVSKSGIPLRKSVTLCRFRVAY